MSLQVSEMSKTYQYRKVMKPMLERKRRARINKCLDKLKDHLVPILESEGEHVTRMEKADILELTVAHLQRLRQRGKLATSQSGNTVMSQAEGFRSGYIHAVNEVSRSLSEMPGVNVQLGTQLMTHLGQRLNQLQPAVKPPMPLTSPLSVHINNPSFRGHYSVPISPVSSYTGSPNSTRSSGRHSASLLTTCTESPIDVTSLDTLDSEKEAVFEQTRREHRAEEADEDENVWRPW